MSFPFANIPAELRALKQHVGWLFQERDGSRTKPPIDAKSWLADPGSIVKNYQAAKADMKNLLDGTNG